MKRKQERHNQRCLLQIQEKQRQSQAIIADMDIPSGVRIRYESRKHATASWTCPSHLMVARWRHNGKTVSSSIPFQYDDDDDSEFKHQIQKAAMQSLAKFYSTANP